MASVNKSVNIDVDLDIEYKYYKGAPATHIDPFEPPSVDIISIKLNGADITDRINESDLYDIETDLLEDGE